MKIVDVTTVRPRVQPNVLFLELRDADGVVGLGESFYGAAAVEAYLHEVVAPRLVELDDVSPESAALALAPYVGYASGGVETRGNGAVDIALWDLIGQRSGLSLATLLGGPIRQRVRTYNTCAGPAYVSRSTAQRSTNWGLPSEPGAPVDLEDLKAFMERPGELAVELLESGITAMKIWPFDLAAEESRGWRLSPADLAAGVAIVERIRDAVGDRMDVMIELHGLWSPAVAAEICHALEPLRPFWVEDPVRPDAVDALRVLRDRTTVRIATGETVTGRRGILPLLRAGVIDVVTPDVGWTGGLTEARKIASLADTFGVGLAPHDCTGPVSLAACTHLVASQPNGLVQESVRAFTRTWYAEAADGVPVVVDGEVVVPTVPGHGVTLRDSMRGPEAALTRSTTLPA